jgi:hypothetical protein
MNIFRQNIAAEFMIKNTNISSHKLYDASNIMRCKPTDKVNLGGFIIRTTHQLYSQEDDS